METVKRVLTIRQFHMDTVAFEDKTTVSSGRLGLDRNLPQKLAEDDDRIDAISVRIISPAERNCYTDTIMDVIPISVKALGRLGEGITHTLTGVYVVLCGCDSDGKQMAEFGSSEGTLSEQMKFGRAGTPGEGDAIIHMTVVLKPGVIGDQRTAPDLIHHTADLYIQAIRNKLKELEACEATSSHVFKDKIRHGGKRVILIKQIGGQGAMHDNRILPHEPSGFSGGHSNIDMGNIPIILSPNEYRDGAIRAMT